MAAKKRSALKNWRDIENEKEKYAAYLCSREWAVLKEAVHKRAGGKCERCRIFPIAAVHHLVYQRKFREELEDLQGHCEHCHAFTHAKASFDPMADDRMTRYLRSCIYRRFGGPPAPVGLFGGCRNSAVDFAMCLKMQLWAFMEMPNSALRDDNCDPSADSVLTSMLWALDKAIGFNLGDLPLDYENGFEPERYSRLLALFDLIPAPDEKYVG